MKRTKQNRYARVVELADSLDSGSSVHYARAGSTPASRTKKKDTASAVSFFFYFNRPRPPEPLSRISTNQANLSRAKSPRVLPLHAKIRSGKYYPSILRHFCCRAGSSLKYAPTDLRFAIYEVLCYTKFLNVKMLPQEKKRGESMSNHMPKGRKRNRGSYIFKYYARACVRRYFQDDVGRESASLAYYLLFSMFPLMLFFSMLLGYAHLNQYPIIASLYDFLPSEAASVVAAYLRHVSSIQLGPMMLAILFACLWFPMRATNSLITAIRKGMGKRPTPRGFLHNQLHLLLYAVFLMLAIVFSVLFMSLSNSVLDFLTATFSLPPLFTPLWRRFRGLVLAVLMLLVLYVFYLNGCDKRHPRFYEVCPGLFGAFAAWMILSNIFSHFTGNISVYSVIYGSISAIVVLMLWLYLTSTVLIMGAIFNQIMNETRKKYGSWKPPLPKEEMRGT